MKGSEKENIMFKIDNNVAIPQPHGSGYGRYPWHDLKEGQSFFVSDKHLSKPGARPSTPLYKTVSRILTENGVQGIRIWRR